MSSLGHVENEQKYGIASSDTIGDVASCNDGDSTWRKRNIKLVVPLRKAWNITRFKRAPRAIQIIRDEVIRHLKVLPEEEIYIDPSVNEKIWERGIENHLVRFASQ